MFLSFKFIKNICLSNYTNYRNHLVFFVQSDWMIYITKDLKTLGKQNFIMKYLCFLNWLDTSKIIHYCFCALSTQSKSFYLEVEQEYLMVLTSLCHWCSQAGSWQHSTPLKINSRHLISISRNCLNVGNFSYCEVAP